MMAGITLGDGLKSVLEHKGYICLAEPACGAGGMCIAAAETLFKQGINYQECLHITAQDIDPLCVHMTYVQLSLLHISRQL